MPRLTPTRRRALRWAALAAWMVVIFLLSAQVSEDSAALSGAVMQVVLAVLDWFARLFGADGFPAGALGALHLVVRKAAHVVAFAVLGGLALSALAPRPGEAADGPGGGDVGMRHMALALAVGVLYATTDEIHQTFVPGRGGQVTDILLDSAGALVGILLLRRWWERQRETKGIPISSP